MGTPRAQRGVRGLTLDAGALIGIERQSTRVRGLLAEHGERASVRIPTPALAQVWRGHARQASLHRFLSTRVVEFVDFDAASARVAGALLGSAGMQDVVDAAVVVCAWRRDDFVVTSDPDDLHRLDPTLRVIAL